LNCNSSLKKTIPQKEFVIKIKDDTILLKRNRQRARLENFWEEDKINVYGFMDMDNYGIEALIVRRINEGKFKVLSPNGGEVWKVGNVYTIKWDGSKFPKDAKIQIGLYNVKFSTEAGLYSEVTIADDILNIC